MTHWTAILTPMAGEDQNLKTLERSFGRVGAEPAKRGKKYVVTLTHEPAPDAPHHIPFSWTEPEVAVLRAAQIAAPQPPTFSGVVAPREYRIYTLKRTYAIRRREGDGRFATILKSTDWSEVLGTLHLENERFKQECSERAVRRREDFKEAIAQYENTCETIRAHITEYLHLTTHLEKVLSYSFHRYVIPGRDLKAPSPGKWKPNFKDGHFLIYEGHRRGEAHVNTELKIYEQGWIVVFVTTYVGYNKNSKYHNAQAYFFSIEDEAFYTRRTNKVKSLGDIDNWAVSFFNGFGFGRPERETVSPKALEPFRYCFICGDPLHYPAIPTKIGTHWVHIMKPCCACYRKLQQDPNLVQKGIDRVRRLYGTLEEEESENGSQ